MSLQLHATGALRTRVIKIRELQNASEKDFEALHKASVARDQLSGGAHPKDLEKSIIRRAREVVREQPTWNTPGIYLWADLDPSAASYPLVYIGIAAFDPQRKAKGQRIGARVADYLTKEYSLLDNQLLNLDEATARERIKTRIASMHNPQKVEAYTHNHMKSYRMCAATHLFYSDATEIYAHLKAVETALIVSGQMSQCDRKLVNLQQTKAKRDSIDESVWFDADLVIRSWGAAGLPERFVKRWRSNASAVVH